MNKKIYSKEDHCDVVDFDWIIDDVNTFNELAVAIEIREKSSGFWWFVYYVIKTGLQ